MASYHLSAKIGKSGSGSKHASYISREGKYSAKQDCEKVIIGNMPNWAKSASDFWEAADKYERANGSVYREFEVALPRELTANERVALVSEFIAAELGEKHTYTVAIHNPRAAIEGGEQPHAHIMYSERLLDGIERPAEQHFKRYNAKNQEKGGCQKASGGKTKEENVAALQASRERWAVLQNKHLQKAGHSAKVDHRSLADQGIARLAEAHIGPKRRDLFVAMRKQRELQKAKPPRKETGLTLGHAEVVVQAWEQGQQQKAANMVQTLVRVGLNDRRWDLNRLEHLQELIDVQTSRPGAGEAMIQKIREANAQQRTQAKGVER